jgi:hypothetical protein
MREARNPNWTCGLPIEISFPSGFLLMGGHACATRPCNIGLRVHVVGFKSKVTNRRKITPFA